MNLNNVLSSIDLDNENLKAEVDDKYSLGSSIIANDLSFELFKKAEELKSDFLAKKLNQWGNDLMDKHGRFENYKEEFKFLLQKSAQIRNLLIENKIKLEFSVDEIVADAIRRVNR